MSPRPIDVSFQRLTLEKRFPLVISRGAMAASENLFVTASDGQFSGIGELSPATGKSWTAERGETQLRAFLASFDVESVSIWETWDAMKERGIDPPAMAALDIALWDLFAKRCGQPLYKVFGLPKNRTCTSVTVGLNPPEVTRERVPIILESTGAKCLKIKLGSPEGLDFDRAHFSAAQESSHAFGVQLRVDANGGWTVDGANSIIPWLAEQGVDYVEQPLVEGAEDDLPYVFNDRKLPIFIDESCRFSTDVPKLADRCDGVNMKLMKCGGPTDALRILAAARAHGLKTMIGCMSESSIAIAAGAAICGALDYVDLDSHLNLAPDPAQGAEIVGGVVAPNDIPGHGASLIKC